MMFVAAAAMMFASCDKENDQQSNGTANQDTASASAFFPTGYDRNGVVAWFTSSETQQDGQVNVQAIYVFNDESMLSTLYKKKADGTVRREIDATGTCSLTSGNYTNGIATVTIPELGMDMTVTIVNGVFTAREVTFTKQDNANIPMAQDPTGNGGQGGSVSDTLLTEAYLPAAYANKTIAAWYAFSNVENDRIKTEAVFLFTDNTMIVTKAKVYTSDRTPEQALEVEGTYELASGDYENGSLNVDADGTRITATISGGVLSAMGEQYAKQANANAPKPTK